MSPQMLHLVRSKPEELHRQSIAAPVALLRNSSTYHCKLQVLGCGYDDVVTGEDYHILRSLLKTSCLAKFRLATDFLATSSLTAEQVAGFVADAILQTYRISLGDVIAGDSEMFFDPSDNMTDFHQIVRLCREPSLLGNRLVDSVALMAGDLEDMSDKVLTLQTELLIMAHECYTAACDMEGISNILRAARMLTWQLVAASEYQLMTRLLTGVGRYNEMTYQQCTEKSPQAPNNIKKLLPLCKDVKVQYRIAKQLGLRDVVANMEKGDSKTYLPEI
ncbi:SPTCS-like protein [Mya arenaria]|uniref:SPTCS-like protein n=1 Tax=Mya arenaria TaxID=6604 RepID=A0ABY7DJ88_MYAAR|nr:SPTCS-like protein [Mya arenaria]